MALLLLQMITVRVLLAAGTVAAALRVDLEPRSAVFRLGERRELRCTVRDCPGSASISWTRLEDKPLFARIHTANLESVMTFDSVTVEHEATLLCKVSCGKESKQTRAVVRVYSFPEAPQVGGHQQLQAGRQQNLVCRVSGVYPAERMTLEWRRGEEVLPSDTEEPDSASVQSTYTFTPSARDAGSGVTCRATLDLPGLAADLRTRETSVNLTLLRPPVITGVSDSVVVMSGSLLALSCSADGDPEPQISWSFSDADGSLRPLSRGPELQIPAVTLSHTGRYVCLAHSMLGNQTAAVEVTVHGRPTNTTISISPGGEVEEGQEVTVSCRTEAAPAGRLVLRRVLQEEEEEEELQHADASSCLSFSLSSAQLQHAGLYRCEAANQYGSQLANTSLTVTAHPLQVEVSPRPAVAERGSGLVLTCRASGCLRPVLTWRRADEPDRRLTDEGEDPDDASRALRLRLQPAKLHDEGEFMCEARCGSVRRANHTQVSVYSFPSDPVLETPGPVLLGQEVVLRCTVHDVYPANRLTVQWLSGNETLRSDLGRSDPGQGPQNVTSQLRRRAERDEALSCRAVLHTEEGEEWRRREASGVLQVHYAPRNTTISISPGGEVEEGQEVTVSCWTEAAPAGRLVLRRVLQEEEEEEELQHADASSCLSFSLSSAQLQHAGLYRCEAANQYGSQLANTSLTVTAPPRNVSVRVLPSAVVEEGENVTIYSEAISFPPSVMVLRKAANGTELQSVGGTFQLVNVTASDSGLYLLNASNELGYQTQTFTISVMERSSGLPPGVSAVIIPVVSVASGLAASALLLDYLRRARRKGFYQLAKSAPASA